MGSSVKSFAATYSWKTAFTPQSRVAVNVQASTVEAAGFALDSVSLIADYAHPNGTVNVTIHQDTSRIYSANAAFTLNKDADELRLNDMKLRFDTTVYATAGPSVIRFGPSGIDIDRFDLRSEKGGRLYVAGTLPSNGPMNLSVNIVQFNIRNVIELLQSDIPAAGTFSVVGRLQGTRANPTIAGAFGLEDFSWQGHTTPEVHGKLSYANQTVTANVDAIKEGGPVILTATGTVPFNLALASVPGSRVPRDQAIALTIKSDSLPLDLIPQFTDMVSDLNGRALANFTVTGTVNNPNVNGQVLLWNGGAKINPLGITVSEVASTIRLQQDTIIVDSLVAHSGGVVKVSGGIGIKTLSAPSFALKLTAQNAHVIDNALADLRANANIDVKGPFNAVSVTGFTRILHGVIYMPESSNKTLVGAGDPALFAVVDTAIASERDLFPAQSPLLANLNMNLGVVVERDVFVRSPEANVEIYTDGALRVTMNNAKSTFVLDGSVESDRGEYRFQGRRFEITHGSAQFVNTPGLNPTLQVTAEYDVQLPTRQAIAIQIVISGTLDQPKIALQSDAEPPIPQTDLLSYLAFGQSTSSLLQQGGNGLTTGGTGSSNIVGQGAAFAAREVAAAALGALTEQFSGQAARSLGADFFDIQPADVSLDASSFLRGTQVEFGKYIQTRTFLQLDVRPDPSSAERPGFELTHRFNDRTGYSLSATFEPRYLLTQPTFSPTQVPQTTSAFGLLLMRQWRF